MRMRIERLCQHPFDKTVGREVVFLAKQLGKVGSTFHKAAAGKIGMRTQAQRKWGRHLLS